MTLCSNWQELVTMRNELLKTWIYPHLTTEKIKSRSRKTNSYHKLSHQHLVSILHPVNLNKSSQSWKIKHITKYWNPMLTRNNQKEKKLGLDFMKRFSNNFSRCFVCYGSLINFEVNFVLGWYHVHYDVKQTLTKC